MTCCRPRRVLRPPDPRPRRGPARAQRRPRPDPGLAGPSAGRAPGRARPAHPAVRPLVRAPAGPPPAAQSRRADSAGPYLRTRVRVRSSCSPGSTSTTPSWPAHPGPARPLARGREHRTRKIRQFLQWAAAAVSPRSLPSPPSRQDPSGSSATTTGWHSSAGASATPPADRRPCRRRARPAVRPARLPDPPPAPQRAQRQCRQHLPHPRLLPDDPAAKVAALLRQLTDTPRQRPLVEKNAPPAWLFPGRPRAGRSDTLSVKLRAHGIDARPARNAALLALIDDIPAPVLADLLDLHPATTVRWSALENGTGPATSAPGPKTSPGRKGGIVHIPNNHSAPVRPGVPLFPSERKTGTDRAPGRPTTCSAGRWPGCQPAPARLVGQANAPCPSAFLRLRALPRRNEPVRHPGAHGACLDCHDRPVYPCSRHPRRGRLGAGQRRVADRWKGLAQ